MSEVLEVADQPATAVAEVLRGGGLAVVPTGGVYAVLADAFNGDAVAKVYAARRRSRAIPLPVVIRSERQLSGLVEEVPEPADRLIAAYWPGLLTLILRQQEGLTWDLGHARGTVQLRLPVEDHLIKVIADIGPLACTAANVLSAPRPTTVEQAREQLGEAVALYVDGGELDGRVSTVVDTTRGTAEVRREGAIPAADIAVVAAGKLPWGERPPPTEPGPGEPSAPDRSGPDLG